MGEIRFVGTGETRGYPYLVCKKWVSFIISGKDKAPKKREVLLLSSAVPKIQWASMLLFVALLFYVHGKHLRSCRDGQLT